MSERLRLRRHLYERLAAARPLSRERRAARRQIAVVGGAPEDTGGGAAGVREPRRPVPTSGPAADQP